MQAAIRQVAIQGELGSFSHEAASALVPSAGIVPCTTAADVLYKVSSARCDAAVIPVENSLVGSVVDFYDLFLEYSFHIERELQMRIRHNLIAAPGASLQTVRKVISHPVALGQCKRFLAANPHLEASSFYDTAGSVRHVMAARDVKLAAIASKQAAMQYGANILREGIEDRQESYTRFWLIRRPGDDAPQESPTKLSILFLLENRPGALLQALTIFATRELNLTKIESRPRADRPWEYMFYADVTITDSAEADAVLRDLEHICPSVKELGRYATGELHPMK